MSNKGDPKITRTLLETVPVEGSDGWETRLYRITYPPGADGSGHSHPVPGVGYVLTGSIASAFGEDKPQIFHAGQSFTDAAHRMHTVSRNASPTEPLSFVIAYTVRSGEAVTVWPEAERNR